ncbi:MAG: 2-dehydropantoate 2-reductase [Candidatus Omnitrophica bacterium]|nr:2-dehydropantoate 2-reductase [Candidatus Omnitrophota bacterium]
MKIAIIGSGAIGGLIAGYLKEKKEDIILITKSCYLSSFRKNRLTISGVRGDFKVKVPISDKLNKKFDLVILATKTQNIEEAIKNNLRYLKNTLVLTTQNGIEAENILKKFIPPQNIIASIVMFGATSLEPTKIIHNFEGKWILGKPFAEIDKNVEKIAKILSKAFSVEISDKILGQKWLKLFLNSNNCIPAILNKSMQEAFSNLDVCEVSIGIWQEALGAIKKAQIKLEDLPDFKVEQLYKLTSLPLNESAKIFSSIMTNLSKEPLYGSVLQSILKNKPSEIDYLNGAFVKLGKEVGYHTPLNKKLVELVHKVEKSKKFLTTEEFLEKTKNLIPRQTKEDQEKINTPFARLKLTVIKVEGDCYHGYKKGDEIILEDFTHPPKFFCLGLAHVLFPVIYALSFGAKFPFSQNQRSLEVTCPDGGKLSFKVEIFDKEGRLENIPKDPNYKGPQPKEMILEVVKSKGNCSYGYKVGDKFKVVGLRCPEGFCGAAYHCAFPALFALNFGAKFFFMDEPNSIDTVTCPDGGKIVFKVARQDA